MLKVYVICLISIARKNGGVDKQPVRVRSAISNFMVTSVAETMVGACHCFCRITGFPKSARRRGERRIRGVDLFSPSVPSFQAAEIFCGKFCREIKIFRRSFLNICCSGGGKGVAKKGQIEKAKETTFLFIVCRF